MKHLKRVLVLLLLLAMACPLFVACGDDEEPPAPPPDNNGTAKVDLLNMTQYSGKTCKLWMRRDSNRGIWVAEAGTAAVDRASFKRLETIKQRTGVTIEVTKSQTSATVYGGGTDGQGVSGDTAMLESLIKSNDLQYDILIPGGVTGCALASRGYLIDMTDTSDGMAKYMDFSRPCWMQQANDALSICGTMFTATGLFSTNVFESISCIYFNKTMMKDIATEEEIAGLYQAAKDGEWTFDKMMQYAAQAYKDVDDFAGKSKNDMFGYMFYKNDTYTTYEAAGYPTISQDEQGVPQVRVGEPKTIEVYQWLKDNVIRLQCTYGYGDDYTNGFTSGKTLFSNGKIANLGEYSQKEDFEFGILPMPKYNTEQANYCGFAHAWGSILAGIPKLAQDYEFSSFCLQLFTEMGYTPWEDGTLTLYEAYIEDSVYGRYAATTENEDMLDIILNSLVYDMSDFYNNWKVTDTLANVYRELFNNGSANPDWKGKADSLIDDTNALILSTLEGMGLVTWAQ